MEEHATCFFCAWKLCGGDRTPIAVQPMACACMLARYGSTFVVMMQAVDFVRKRLARRMAPQAICEAMCDHCLAPDTQAGFIM